MNLFRIGNCGNATEEKLCPPLKALITKNLTVSLLAGTCSWAIALSHQTSLPPFLIILSKKSWSSPPLRPYRGSNGCANSLKTDLFTAALPAAPEFLIVPVRKRGLSIKPPLIIHPGVFTSKIGNTGPRTTSALKSSKVLIKSPSQFSSTNSSSSTKTMISPPAWDRQRLRARAIFCSSSRS